MKIVFLAPLGSAFGEALHGVRLALALRARGHEAIFLGPEALAPLVSDTPLRFGRIDAALERLPAAVHEVVQAEAADALVLVDLAGAAKACHVLGLRFRKLLRAGAPVVALDAWGLSETGLDWDYGPDTYRMGDEPSAVPRRLVPVPFARPEIAGGYDALPDIGPGSAAERALVRDELGLSDADRLVLWPMARWQYADSQPEPSRRRLAAAVPALLMAQLAQLGGRVRVLHVGPEPLPPGPLGARYQHAGQQGPEVFAQLARSADLLVSYNAAATSLGTAVAARLPVLLAQVGVGGQDAAAVEAALAARAGHAAAAADAAPRTAEPAGSAGEVQRASEPAGSAGRAAIGPIVRAWLPEALPLRPLAACPLSLHAFLRPVLAANPFYEALDVVELLDEAETIARARALLFDGAAADAQRQRQERYAARVRALPQGADLLLALLRDAAR